MKGDRVAGIALAALLIAAAHGLLALAAALSDRVLPGPSLNVTGSAAASAVVTPPLYDGGVSALSPVGFAVAGRVVLLLYTCAGDGASPVARVHTELKWLACYARASAMPPAGLPQPLRASVWCIVL